MYPILDNPNQIELSPAAVLVLQRVFTGYRRIILIKEFMAGLSGSRVFEVRPIRANGTPELPTVVKLGSTSLIQLEWRAYQKHIHNRLPQIATISKRPTPVSGTGMAGLRYPMLGHGDDNIMSLRDFFRQPDVSAEQIQLIVEQLLRTMDHVWGFQQSVREYWLQQSYSAILPPDLLIRTITPPQDVVLTAIHGRKPIQDVAHGTWVSLSRFQVHKVDLLRNTLTLRSPQKHASYPGSYPASYPACWVRVRLPETAPMPELRVHQLIDIPAGEVVETRMSRLYAEVAKLFPNMHPDAAEIELANDVRLPNPLIQLKHMLNHVQPVNVATIHGDLNLENILIAPQQSSVGLIDFANARQDHVLHDLIHLEAEVLIHLLPEIIQHYRFDPVLVLAEFSCQLHTALTLPNREQSMPEHPALQKPWVVLRSIRRAARRYLFDTNRADEYYLGLILYLLGILRYQHLDHTPEQPLAKRIAFWAATLAYQWFLHANSLDPHGSNRPIGLQPLLERSQALWSHTYTTHHFDTKQPQLANPEVTAETRLLASMPIEYIPPNGVLPNSSRMLLDRNWRFVGRRAQLLRIAAALKPQQLTIPDQPIGIGIVGMGGVGKTQLACEFAYRYGRFFAGGVFWLSCADSSAIAAEIAACGTHGLLRSTPGAAIPAFDEQVRLVLAEWARPIPRLLIFDNCENPELLANWLPVGGGCRVIVTSRRADWLTTFAVPMLKLDVLQRNESVALLREHQPDGETQVLAAIGSELGDLPLALHLAGSYLARYRTTINPEVYLQQICNISPLRHESLQSSSILPTEHDPHVARTFALSYDQLDVDQPIARLARTLLHSAACLAPGEPIPASLATLAIAADANTPEAVLQGKRQLGLAIDQLIELGLIRSEANHTLWVHRLVIAFIRERLGERLGDVQASVERTLCAEAERLNAGRDPAELHGWQVHLRAIADAAIAHKKPIAADVCHALAEHLYQSGDYHGARTFHEHALAIRKLALGEQHPATAQSLAQIGKVLLFYGDTALAEPYFTQALQIQFATLGDHNDTATTLNHLGFLLQQQSRFAEARYFHEETLRVRRMLLGIDHPAIVDSLCNLAFVEYGQGNPDIAQAYLEQALTIQKQATGEAHPETARVLTNLGELFLAKRDVPSAKAMLNQALAIQRSELGTEHPETARILGDLGDVARLSNNIIQAREYYQQALRVFRACHGPDHPRTRWIEQELTAISAS